jgi:hypothetical protein
MPGAPTQVNISAPPLVPLTTILDYGGGSNLVYRGWALSAQGRHATLSPVASFTAATPGVMTFTVAHGLNYDTTDSKATAQPSVAISGGTGNWAAVNGIWIFQPTSTTAGTLASVVGGLLTQLDTSTFGALAGTLTVNTLSPRTSDPVWSIQTFVYSTASGAQIWSGWPSQANGAGTPTNQLGGGSSASNFIWDNRALYGYM